jgi:hypothetical protein
MSGEEVYVMTMKGSPAQTGTDGVLNPVVFKTFEDIEKDIVGQYCNENAGWQLEVSKNPRWHGIGIISVVKKNDLGKVIKRTVFKTFMSVVNTYE